MEDQKNNLPQPEWEEWDAASVLYFKKAGITPVSEQPESEKESTSTKPKRSSLPEAPVRLPRERRKPRPNYKGWAILIGAAVLAILLLVLLIYGVVALASSASEPKETTEATTTTETEPTTTVDYEALAAGLLKTAERQAVTALPISC